MKKNKEQDKVNTAVFVTSKLRDWIVCDSCVWCKEMLELKMDQVQWIRIYLIVGERHMDMCVGIDQAILSFFYEKSTQVWRQCGNTILL